MDQIFVWSISAVGYNNSNGNPQFWQQSATDTL